LAVVNIIEMFYTVTSRPTVRERSTIINGYLSKFRPSPPYDGTLTV